MQTFSKLSIGHEAARAVASQAIAEASSLGLKICVAVVDESGLLKTADRMDGADFVAVASAHNKAYTAAGFKIATISLYERIKEDPALLFGVPATDRTIIFGGGVPIRVDGIVIGAVGVGGGTHHQDHEIAERSARSIEARGAVDG